MLLQKRLRRRELIKNAIIITLILALAVGATYFIYYKFKDNRNQVNTSKSLEVTFHEKAGALVTLTKVAPVTDSVGLSSHAYTFTIKNNLTTPVNYSIKIIKDQEAMLNDFCGEYQIPLNVIKGAIHETKKKNNYFIMSELDDNIILNKVIDGGDSIEYTVRFWIISNTLPLDSDLHYHGKLLVAEDGVDIATAIN